MSDHLLHDMAGDFPKENIANYNRLVTFLMEEGVARARNYLATHLPPGMSIEQTLQFQFQKLKLLKERERVISGRQWAQLFPKTQGSVVNINNLDLSLTVILIRNIASNENNINWNRNPRDRDVYPEHDILRLKLMRNSLCHRDGNEMGGEEFCREWHRLATTLMRLGTTGDTVKYHLNKDLDPTATERHCNQLREQWVEDRLEVMFLEKNTHRCFKISIAITMLLAVLIVAIIVAVILIQQKYHCIDSMKILRIKRPMDQFETLQYVPRQGWGAKPPKGRMYKLQFPIHYVVVTETQTSGRFDDTDKCCAVIKRLQDELKDNKDIGWNFLIGEDGVLYEGRGWEYEGGHTKGWNYLSYGIALIGSFQTRMPDCSAMKSLKLFLDYAIQNGWLSTNFTLFGRCQLRPPPDAPGRQVYTELQLWPHWAYFRDSGRQPGPSSHYCLQHKPKDAELQCDIPLI